MKRREKFHHNRELSSVKLQVGRYQNSRDVTGNLNPGNVLDTENPA